MALESYAVDNAAGTVELELLSTVDPPDEAGGTILYIRINPEDEDIIQLCVRFENGEISVIEDDIEEEG